MATFTEIATFVDSVDPPASFRALSDHHTWASDEDRWSFRAIVGRHAHPSRVEQRFVFLNTFLMDIPWDDWIGDSTDGTKPRVDARAREIGQYVRANADITALCEVWTNSVKDKILEQWPEEPDNRSRITRLAGGFGRPREEKRKGSSGLLTISQDHTTTSRQFEEYEHESGIDNQADKGVLRVGIDVGLGPSELVVYSTHLQAGDKKTALRQVVQLGTFVLETRNERDSALIVGDFNINEHSTESFSTEEVLEVNFAERVPEIVRRAVRETVDDGVPTGRVVAEKTGHEILRDVMSVLGFSDLWATRNGTPGYTSDITDPGAAERICPPDSRDGRFCDDDVPGGLSDASRIDYVFVSEPSPEQSFTLDFTRPRRLRLERAPDAPGRDEIAFLSDHIGLATTLLMAPT